MHSRFCIGLPKILRRIRIGPPKIHRRFRIGPPQVILNLLPPEFYNRWILVYHGYHARNAIKLPIWNRIDYNDYVKGCYCHLTSETIDGQQYYTNEVYNFEIERAKAEIENVLKEGLEKGIISNYHEKKKNLTEISNFA